MTILLIVTVIIAVSVSCSSSDAKAPVPKIAQVTEIAPPPVQPKKPGFADWLSSHFPGGPFTDKAGNYKCGLRLQEKIGSSYKASGRASWFSTESKEMMLDVELTITFDSDGDAWACNRAQSSARGTFLGLEVEGHERINPCVVLMEACTGKSNE
jgi:hypothetical protein